MRAAHDNPGNPVRHLVFLLPILLVSCADQDNTAEIELLFAQGEYLCLEAQWGEARDVLRQVLLKNPDHPGAHFYLGRAYLNWEDTFRPVIAEGELQLALQLFHENNRISYIERFPPEYFVLICNIEAVKVCITQFGILEVIAAPKSQLRSVAKRARAYLEAAREAIPDSPDVKTFEGYVRDVEAVAS